jgi:hypothetical protein
MSSTTRAYVKGDDPMFRSVTPYEESFWARDAQGFLVREGTGKTLYRYAGPYTTVGAAKRSRGTGGWVEVCHPVWEKLEE